MDVQVGCPADVTAVMTVFDSGGLEVSLERVERAIRADHLLVAVRDGRVLGALLLDPRGHAGETQIEAIAVRPGRRGQGIGRSLVRSAAERCGTLVAAFDEPVKPFWDSLGFEISPKAGAARYRARGENLPGPD